MAKTIAICTGIDTNGRQKEVHRLGSFAAQSQVNTWQTFVSCQVNADGSGYVLVQRNGVTLHSYEFGAEEYA